VLDCFLPEALV